MRRRLMAVLLNPLRMRYRPCRDSKPRPTVSTSTVIGSTVNLVSRIETTAKSLDLALIFSADFASAHGR
jgi:class 3 adenylate cyclase